MVDRDLAHQLDEERLRSEFERVNSQAIIEEEGDDLRVLLIEEATANDLDMDKWNDYLDKELSVFKSGEKYDYVKDLQDAYKEGLRKPLALKILDTIPDHVFWDIKKPINKETEMKLNRYNPARKIANDDFFDFRSQDEWMKERSEKRLLKPSVSKFRNY